MYVYWIIERLRMARFSQKYLDDQDITDAIEKLGY